MKVNDKRNHIISAIQSTDDEKLIEEVYDLLHPDERVEHVDTSELPEYLQDKINRGLNDYENGRYLSHEEMKQKMQQWLLK